MCEAWVTNGREGWWRVPVESRVPPEGDVRDGAVLGAGVAGSRAVRASPVTARGVGPGAADTPKFAMFTMDLVGRLASWGPTAGELFGYAAGQVLGRHVCDVLMRGDHRAVVRDALTGVGADRAWTAVLRVMRADGDAGEIAFRFLFDRLDRETAERIAGYAGTAELVSDYSSFLAVPLAARGAVVGSAVFARLRGSAGFTGVDVALGVGFAARGGVHRQRPALRQGAPHRACAATQAAAGPARRARWPGRCPSLRAGRYQHRRRRLVRHHRAFRRQSGARRRRCDGSWS
jgi:hypothetical protein